MRATVLVHFWLYVPICHSKFKTETENYQKVIEVTFHCCISHSWKKKDLLAANLVLLMKSIHLPITREYERLAHKMTSRVYPQTCQQTHSKFKNIKKAFMMSLEQWKGETNVSVRSPLPPCHDEMVCFLIDVCIFCIMLNTCLYKVFMF